MCLVNASGEGSHSIDEGVRMMRVQFIHPESRLWQQCLAEMPHDFYHTPGYLQLCADRDGGVAQAFVAEDGEHRLFVPLIVRPIDRNGAARGIK